MKKMLVSLLILVSIFTLFGQEIKTIDNTGNGDFVNLVEAVNYINGLTTMPDGGVQLNITAGQTFTDSIPTITVQATESAPILFTKVGEGENPIVDYNYMDGSVFHFDNAAYITLENITITDMTDDAIQYEKAVYVFASQNITIQNCSLENFSKYGVHVRDASANTTIHNNELYHTETYDTEQASIYAIYVQFNADADNAIITNNKIHSLKEASAGVYGIRTQKVKTLIANNFISVTNDNNDKIYAIRCDAGSEGLIIDVLYNTVFLSGVATDKDYCFYRTGTVGLVNVQNNIFVNKRTGDFEHVVFDYTFVSGDWFANNNTYYCENGFIGYWGNTTCNTLEEWQVATENDANSNNVDVEFVSGTDLHLAGTALGNFDLAAAPIEVVTTDIDGDTRSSVNPYKGADENLETPLMFTLESSYVIDNTGNGDLETISEAINLVNANTIPEGGVTFNITAGQIFTEDFASITAQGTETSPIIFQQYGEGDKPVIQSETADQKVFFAEAAAYLRFYNLKVADPDPANDLKYHTAFDMDDVNNVIIENCVAENFGKYGIYSHGATVDAIYNLNETYYTEEYFTDQTTVAGIKSSYNSQAGHVTISNNKIYGFKTVTSTLYGIDYNQVEGEVFNNTISLTEDGNDKIYGIRTVGRAGLTHKVYNNTVYLAGTSTDEGYAIATAGGGGDLSVKNNILQNARPEEDQYSVFIMFPFVGLEFENNVYYNNETTPFRAKRQSEIYTDLATWITNEEQDANSVVYGAEYVNETAGDLHVAGTSLGNQNLIAIPLEEVLTDIDGETRHAEFPYCGADENVENPLVINMGGEYTIDTTGNGDFISIAEAVTSLNRAQIEDGGIIFNITAGQTFTDSIPTISAQGTETAPITFRKFGEGENPVVDYNFMDGSVFHFENAAYITLENITITDMTADAIQYEKAVYVFASHNITIQNCELENFSKYGVHVRDASVNTTIHNNELYHTEAYDTEQSSIYAIYVQYNADADNAIITNNKIHSLKEASAGVYGIRTQKVNTLIANNFISVTHDNNDKLYGIRCDAGTESLVMNVFFNTVYFEGIATDADFCFYRTGTDGLVNLQNNIFVNKRTGDFEHVVFDYTFVAGDWSANYNTYYCENGAIGNWGDTVCNTLEEWQTATENDASSNIVNTEFVSGTDLHLTGTSLQNYDLAGFPIETITTDIDGETRHAVNPYKGADENTEFPLNPEDQYAIEVSPLTLDFGTIYNTTNSDSMAVIVANIGAEALTINSIAIDGDFEFRTDSSDWTTTMETFEIPATESKNVYVRFAPTSANTFSNTLTIESNASENSSIDVALTAISVDAGITLSQTEMNFPYTVVETEMTDSFIIHNNNDISLTIDSITLAEPFAFQFGENEYANTMENVEIQDSLLVQVRYLPTEIVESDETLSIMSSLFTTAELAISGNAYESSFNQVQPFMSGIWVGDSQVGDYDNDGDLDILTSGYGIPSGTSHINLYRNNGNDEYEEIETDMQGVGNGCLYWIDIDNDNDLDIYLSGQYQFENYINRLYINNGGEYSEIETNLPILLGATIDWKDYNGDGLLDAFMMGTMDVQDDDDIAVSDIFINQGDGNFEALDLNILQMLNGDGKFFDFNNDGLLDIVYTGRVGSWNYRTFVLKNAGNNVFATIELEGEGLRDGTLEVGDYDNDGDMDIFVTGTFDQAVPSETHIYRNDGDDTFVNINADNSLIGVRRGQLTLGDLDSDGDLDFAINGVTSEHYWAGSVYFNMGNDYFVEADSLVALKYGEFSLGDMDGDLDLDVVLTGRFASEIYVSALFKNDGVFQNTAPEAPQSLASEVDQDVITLTWDAATDEQTPSQALTYNLKIGTTSGGNDILSAQAMDDGTRLTSGVGNMISSLGASVSGLPNGTYYASVQAVDHSFIGSSFSEEIVIEVTQSTGEDFAVNPLMTKLKGNYPNPFNPTTNINFSVKKDQNVKIEIYNIRGQKVSTIADSKFAKGNHQITWNGTNDAGNGISSGVYFYKMTTEEYTKTKKMMLLK